MKNKCPGSASLEDIENAVDKVSKGENTPVYSIIGRGSSIYCNEGGGFVFTNYWFAYAYQRRLRTVD